MVDDSSMSGISHSLGSATKNTSKSDPKWNSK